MKQFTAVSDVNGSVDQLIQLAGAMKEEPYKFNSMGKNKTLAMLFFNPSLRTRLSTEKAALNLGMSTMVMNLDQNGWKLEFEDGVVMNLDTQEHIKEAAAVVSLYCDIVGIRTFPSLSDRDRDYSEVVLNQFIRHSTVPVISLESATRHPLQSFADLLTIYEHIRVKKPKVVLSWAPHPKALPQSVPNSFCEWMLRDEIELIVTNPEGFNLSPKFTSDAPILHNQEEAFRGADFIYAKNWSSFENYGAASSEHDEWIITQKKMDLTNDGYFMHCLPVRRNVVVSDQVLDSEQSLVLKQSNNRLYCAQAILANLLGNEG